MVSPKTMVVWSCQSNVTMMILLWLASLTCSGPSCPSDLLIEVFSCLRNLTHGSNQSTLMSAIDAEHMQRNCRSGAFDDSVKCLERLYSQCTNPEAKEWLQKLARPRRWKAGFQRFCQYVNLYTEQKHCIQQQNTKVETCVKSHDDVFTNKNDVLLYETNGYSVNEDKIKSVCRVFHWTDYCLNQPLGLSCGEPVGAIVKDFQGGITPPICDYFEINSKSHKKLAPRITIFLCVILTVIFRFFL